VCCGWAGVKEAPLPAEMEALAERLRREEGLLLADELPPDTVTAKAAFAVHVRDFLRQQARRLCCNQLVLLCHRLGHCSIAGHCTCYDKLYHSILLAVRMLSQYTAESGTCSLFCWLGAHFRSSCLCEAC